MITKVQSLRQYYGLIQEDFAGRVGISKSSLQSIEKGNRIRTSTARLIAVALDQPIKNLFFTGANSKYLSPLYEFKIGEQ